MDTQAIQTKVDNIKHSIKILIETTGMPAAAGPYALKLIDIIDTLLELYQNGNNELENRMNNELDFMIISPIEAIYDIICGDRNIDKIDRNSMDASKYKSAMMQELNRIAETEKC